MTSNLSIFENEMSKWIIGCVYLQNEFQTFDFEIICLVNVWDWLQSVRLYIFVYESIKTEKLKSFSEIIEVLQYNRVSKVLFWVSWKYTEYDYLHLPNNWSVFQAGKICFQDLCEIRPRNGRPKIKKKEELNLELISYPACETKNQFIFNGRKFRRRNALKL